MIPRAVLVILIVAMAVVLMLPGCANLPADPAKMSPEQLKEWAKDKNANAACTVVNSPWGRGVMSYLVLDKGLIIDGTVTIDNECKISVTSNPKKIEPDSRAPVKP